MRLASRWRCWDWWWGCAPSLRLAADVGATLASLIPSEDQAETVEPGARSVSYTSSAGDEVPADLYVPPESGPGPALILVNGVEVTGRRHPVLVALAESFARAGFVVLAPEQLGNAAYRLVDRDPDALVAGFEFLSRQPEVDPKRIAFVGVSTGGSLSLVAAADPRIADDVAFVATVGSYYSLATLLQAATTGDHLRRRQLRTLQSPFLRVGRRAQHVGQPFVGPQRSADAL